MPVAHTPVTTENAIRTALKRIGATPERVVRLRPGEAIDGSNFEYADLLDAHASLGVEAVVEKDGSPLLYVSAASGAEAEQRLARVLANRAETALLLAVDQTAHARAWHCSLDRPSSREIDLANDASAASVLGDLQSGLWADPKHGWQEQRLRELLVDGVRHVAAALRDASPQASESQQEVLGLVGRALFSRFLVDRGILSARTAPKLWRQLDSAPEHAFADAERAAALCDWLDATFNGEFLPLPLRGRNYAQYFQSMVKRSGQALAPLGWIMHRTETGGQLSMWNALDFSHIPVGTLSEVYEDYAHHSAPDYARATSVHFTPRHIARTMVRQAFAGLELPLAAAARVLDPAVGAAVFLGLSYRELARLHFEAHGRWPDTAQLRKILYEQLRGMDINGAALNLAALTLYLTAIELDASPLPPEKLHFKRPLLGNVLFDVGAPKRKGEVVLGSLAPECPAGSDFDVVIANPPWTSASGRTAEGKALTKAVEALASRTVEERAAALKLRYAHPDNVPDLAFAWKATTWARPGGVIALILHHRLLTKASETWRQARQALFATMEVSGIVNAGEFALHHRLIWPDMEQPFCILFARNRAAAIEHRITVLTPIVEPALRARRQIRMDPQATVRLAASELDESPNALTVLAKASELDLTFFRRWIARVNTPAGRKCDDGRAPMMTLGDCLLRFQALKPARGMKQGGSQSNRKTPHWYATLPLGTLELPAQEHRGFVDTRALPLFKKREVRSTPPLEYYTSALTLLIREAPGGLSEPARAFLLRAAPSAPVIFPYSYLGVPIADTPEQLIRAKYTCLWINSSLFAYFQTLTASRFTFGIKVINDPEILAFPMVSFEVAAQGHPKLEEETERLFVRWASGKPGSADALNEWVFRIAGFTTAEQELVEDTLSDAYPVGVESRNSSYQWAENTLMQQFALRLAREVAEVASDAVDPQSVRMLNSSMEFAPGWRFIAWRPKAPTDTKSVRTISDLSDSSLLQLVRDSYPQGRVWAATTDGWCVFGQLALRRFWLPSRAPLLAATVVAWADSHG